MIGGTPSRVPITQLVQAATLTCEGRRCLQILSRWHRHSPKAVHMINRYFFDIRDNHELYPDEDGIEFSTQREAEIEAAHTLAGLARDLAGQEDRPDVAVEVRTEAGRLFQAALIFEANKCKQ